jgi:hypothetical protein
MIFEFHWQVQQNLAFSLLFSNIYKDAAKKTLAFTCFPRAPYKGKRRKAKPKKS